MRSKDLSDADRELVAAAEDIVRQRYRQGWNEVGAALRMRSGEIVQAIHLEEDVGRIALCAEAVALGKVIADGLPANEISVVVAVIPEDQELTGFQVLDSCGMCRELLTDYAPDAESILALDGELRRVPFADLIPGKSDRTIGLIGEGVS